MKKSPLLLSLFCLVLFSWSACRNKNSPESSKPENDIDAARSFIRATLDGDYKTAGKLLLEDSVNTQWLSVLERSYMEKMSDKDKNGYRAASINIHEVNPQNDSVSLIRYSNSYFNNDTHQLRVVKQTGKWLVDLKYYFGTGKDSIQ